MPQPEDDGVLDAEVVEEVGDGNSGQELVAAQAVSATLFNTDDPELVIRRAGRVADMLKDILKQQGLTTRISGREHVQVEGWQTTGSMLGVFAVESWTRPVPSPDGADTQKGPWGYESRYEARTISGAVVGAGVARCTRSEGTWKSRDDYALMSMAQTRATSKALKAPLGWIVALAGYSATPEEEMPRDEGPAFGPAASEELERKMYEALGVLAIPTEKHYMVLEKMAQDAGGKLPQISARAVCHVATTRMTVAAATTKEDAPDGGDDQ